METKIIHQKNLSPECWSVQFWGKNCYKTREYYHAKERGGKNIIKNGKNVLLIGGVATGKTELMKRICNRFDLTAVDSGKYFRLFAHLLLKKNDFNPDFELIRNGDMIENGRIIRLSDNTLKSLPLEDIQIKKTNCGDKFYYHEKDITDFLDTNKIDNLVPIISKSSFARKFAWSIIEKHHNDGMVLTAHSLSDIDTTDFRIINLRANNKVSAERLMRRNPEKYSSFEMAKKHVIERNKKDNIGKTEKLISGYFGTLVIDTSKLTINKVFQIACDWLTEEANEIKIRVEFQNINNVKKSDFVWRINKKLEYIRQKTEKIIEKLLIPSTIDKFDLILQTLIHYAGNPKIELRKEILKQINKISKITKKRDYLPIHYSINRNPFNCKKLEIRKAELIKPIIFRRIPRELSYKFEEAFHYLHKGRLDNIYCFGAFLENDDFPFAFVSYSKIGRDYKQEMLDYLGIEPRLVLEMTRAWNTSWSPKNTMSSLFTFAHKELQQIWKEKIKNGNEYKSLSGILTSINPNLGFKANAFKGVGFDVIGLKPTQFTYYKNNGNLTYIPRRDLIKKLGLVNTNQLYGHKNFATNEIDLVPTCEMLVLFDIRKQVELREKPIYIINEEKYNYTK